MSTLIFIALVSVILFFVTLVVGFNGMKKAGHNEERHNS
jgi:hypothetical protein